MAISSAVAGLPATKSLAAADITATADGDTTIDFAHGMGVAPPTVILTPLLQAAAALSAWAVTAIDATKVTLTKSTATGSGTANPQVRVTCINHSILG